MRTDQKTHLVHDIDIVPEPSRLLSLCAPAPLLVRRQVRRGGPNEEERFGAAKNVTAKARVSERRKECTKQRTRRPSSQQSRYASPAGEEGSAINQRPSIRTSYGPTPRHRHQAVLLHARVHPRILLVLWPDGLDPIEFPATRSIQLLPREETRATHRTISGAITRCARLLSLTSSEMTLRTLSRFGSV